MTYEPNAGAQADIEATEWVRSRTQQRQALVENQIQMLLKQVRLLREHLVKETEVRRLAQECAELELAELREELATQRRVTAQMMRERA